MKMFSVGLFTLLVIVKGAYIERDYVDNIDHVNCPARTPLAGIKFKEVGINCTKEKDIISDAILVNIKHVHWIKWPHLIEEVWGYNGWYWERERSTVYVRRAGFIEINPSF